MKHILILSQHLHINYGGLLQAYALQKTVKDLGFEPATNSVLLKDMQKSIIKKILDFCSNKTKKVIKVVLGHNVMTAEKYKIISRNTQRFINQFIQTDQITKLSDAAVEKYDIVLVGSDQVFRKKYSPVTEYFLNGLKNRNDKIKLTYAASFGIDDLSDWTNKEITICKTLAPKFKAISVREDSGVDIFKNVFNTHADLVLDPTLLLEKKDYEKILDEEDSVGNSNVLMCYVLDKSPQKTQIINQIKQKTRLDLLEVMPEQIFNKNTKDIEKCIYPSVSKWIAGFRDANFVVTDSFHGTVFAIIFNKPFVCIGNKERGLSRFTSLLKIFGLENRLVFSPEDFSDKLLEGIDYEKVNSIKKQWQEKSITFLKDNLK